MALDQAEKLRYAALKAFRSSVLAAGRGENKNCRVIAVGSGKGGVGKTNLALNLGLALKKQGFKVTLIDADLGLANLDVLLNLRPQFTLNDVLNGSKTMEEIVLSGPLGLKIVPGASGLFELANLDQAKRQHLLYQLSLLEKEEDYLIIDTSAGLSRNVVSLIGAADDFILVTTPEPTALTDAYGLLKVLASQGLKEEAAVVVNLTERAAQGESTFNRLKKVTTAYLPQVKLHYLGCLRRDVAVARAVENFYPFVLSRPAGPASAEVKRIAWRLSAGVDTRPAETGSPVGFFNRLKTLFSG